MELVNASAGLRAGMSNSRVVYTPRPDATPEAEANALAAVYRLILASKKAVPQPPPTTRKVRKREGGRHVNI